MVPIKRITYAMKVVIAHVLYAIGLLQLWKCIALKRRAVVLMYHRVLTNEERLQTSSHPGIVVDRETFAQQMAVLKRHFVVLNIEEFTNRIERHIPFDDGSCLITFDDGWKDNFIHALPVLRQNGLPAVIFLPVNFIGRQRMFWQERLTHLVFKAVMQARRDPQRRLQIRHVLSAVGLDSVLDLPDQNPLHAIMEAVRQQKGLANSVIDKALTDLAGEIGSQADDGNKDVDGFLDWDQVEAMSRQGIAFGGHGAEHRLLTAVSSDEARDEIRTAKTMISGRVKCGVPTFSYPNGNASPLVADLVKESGYRAAFTTKPGFVKCNDDRFAVRRINIHESMTSSTPMFLARVLGLL